MPWSDADVSVAGGVLAAFVLLAVNRGVSTLRLCGEFWGRLLEGAPTVLIEDGDFVVPHLQKEGVERSELETAMRERRVESVQEVSWPRSKPMVRSVSFRNRPGDAHP